MRRSDSPEPGFKSVSTTVITAFAAGFPAMVTRPLTEAVRGRLSRCGVCALATVKTARRTVERKIRNRVNRNIRSLLEGRREAATNRPPTVVKRVYVRTGGAFEAIMTTRILRMALRRRKRRIFHLRCGKVRTDDTGSRRGVL